MLKQAFTTAAIACLFGCGGGSTSPATQVNNTPPPTGGISVTNNLFTPDAKTVSVGTAVTWAWNSCTDNGYNGMSCVTHDIVFDDGRTSGALSSGTYNRTFTAAGVYPYHCSIHGAAMSGSITVQ
jgi:plastocyanin